VELSYESVSKVRFAMKDMVRRMVAEEYLTTNIAEGLKVTSTRPRWTKLCNMLRV
jgi:hypothetical protein